MLVDEDEVEVDVDVLVEVEDVVVVIVAGNVVLVVSEGVVSCATPTIPVTCE